MKPPEKRDVKPLELNPLLKRKINTGPAHQIIFPKSPRESTTLLERLVQTPPNPNLNKLKPLSSEIPKFAPTTERRLQQLIREAAKGGKLPLFEKESHPNQLVDAYLRRKAIAIAGKKLKPPK